MGMWTQSLDEMLWRADLGPPSSDLAIRVSTQEARTSGSYLCAPGREAGLCRQTTKPGQAESPQHQALRTSVCRSVGDTEEDARKPRPQRL